MPGTRIVNERDAKLDVVLRLHVDMVVGGNAKPMHKDVDVKAAVREAPVRRAGSWTLANAR